MKKTKNLLLFVLAYFIPLLTIPIVSSLLKIDLGVFILMIITSIGLFAYEIVAAQRCEDYIWKVVSRSTNDKIIFAVCYCLFWIIVELPLYLKLDPIWVFVAIIVGYLGSMIIFWLFASHAMKEELPKYLRPRFRLK